MGWTCLLKSTAGGWAARLLNEPSAATASNIKRFSLNRMFKIAFVRTCALNLWGRECRLPFMEAFYLYNTFSEGSGLQGGVRNAGYGLAVPWYLTRKLAWG